MTASDGYGICQGKPKERNISLNQMRAPVVFRRFSRATLGSKRRKVAIYEYFG